MGLGFFVLHLLPFLRFCPPPSLPLLVLVAVPIGYRGAGAAGGAAGGAGGGRVGADCWGGLVV